MATIYRIFHQSDYYTNSFNFLQHSAAGVELYALTSIRVYGYRSAAIGIWDKFLWNSLFLIIS